MQHHVPVKGLGLCLLLAAGCAHDPAHDRPIEPWASPAVTDTVDPPPSSSDDAGVDAAK